MSILGVEWIGRCSHLICAASISVVILLAATASAEEPAEKFLNALREAGYHDVALEYLTEIESNQNLTPEFREALPFEKANTLIKSVATLRDAKEWERRLDDAQGLLEQAASNAVTPELKSKSRSYQGELLYLRARSYTNQITRDAERLTASERNKLATQARTQLNKAVTAFEEAKTLLAEVLKGFQVDPNDPRFSESRLRSLRKKFTNIRIKSPKIVEELADTYPESDPQYKVLLKKAIDGYTEIWNKYRSYDAGYYARYYSARCHFKLKEYPNAINNIQDALSGANNPTTRQLKPLSLALLADCWTATDPYPHDEVIALFGPEIERMDRRKLREPNNQRLQLELARAYHVKAEELKKAGQAAKSKSFAGKAAKIVKAIARVPSIHRERAKKFIAAWNISMNAEEPEIEKVKIDTFADAKRTGTDATVELQTLVADNLTIKRRLRSAKTADEKLAVQAELDGANDVLNSKGRRALAIFDRALKLTDDKTPRSEINNIHYLRSYCYFAMGRLLESSVISEYMLETYPTIEGSRQASGLLVQSLKLMLDKIQEQEKQEEYQRVAKLSDEVIARYPGSKEAVLAAKTVTQLALVERDFDRAIKYFETVPTSSDSYGELSIKVGRAAWFDYLGLREVLQSTPEKADKETMQRRLGQAKDYLAKGVQSQDNKVTYAAALGALFLIDVQLEAGDTAAAIKQLDSDALAPIDLVKQKHPAILRNPQANAFIGKTYKTAIKVYLAAMRENPGETVWVDRAQGVMAAMRENAQRSNDPKVKNNVDAIYRRIASELKQQFATINQAAEQDRYVDSLTQFLNTIQTDTRDPDTARWAGSTLIEIADVLAMRGDRKEKASGLFQQGLTALNSAKKLGVKDPAKIREIERLSAIALRGAGNYEKAVEKLKTLLKQNTRDLRLQMDAVETLQAWGIQTKRANALAEALQGVQYVDEKDNRRKALIWGWEQLVKSLKDNPKLKQSYYKSLFGMIQARYEHGVITDKIATRKSALTLLTRARKRDKELGGPAWKAKLDALESEIEKSL